MTNKNILIIGSSGGIGKAFVDIFAKQMLIIRLLAYQDQKTKILKTFMPIIF